MNILLNLLPEDKKAFLKEKVRSRFVFSQMLMLSFLHGLYVCILIGAYFSLEHNESSFQGMSQQLESGESRKSLLEIETKFQDINKQVAVVTLINREHLHFTKLLSLLGQTIPPGVKLSSVSTKDYVVSLTGKAAKRNDMVALEKSLNEESCFAAVDIPPSVWLSPEDISFQIGFSLNKECIKK